METASIVASSLDLSGVVDFEKPGSGILTCSNDYNDEMQVANGDQNCFKIVYDYPLDTDITRTCFFCSLTENLSDPAEIELSISSMDIIQTSDLLFLDFYHGISADQGLADRYTTTASSSVTRRQVGDIIGSFSITKGSRLNRVMRGQVVEF